MSSLGVNDSRTVYEIAVIFLILRLWNRLNKKAITFSPTLLISIKSFHNQAFFALRWIQIDVEINSYGNSLKFESGENIISAILMTY